MLILSYRLIQIHWYFVLVGPSHIPKKKQQQQKVSKKAQVPSSTPNLEGFLELQLQHATFRIHITRGFPPAPTNQGRPKPPHRAFAQTFIWSLGGRDYLTAWPWCITHHRATNCHDAAQNGEKKTDALWGTSKMWRRNLLVIPDVCGSPKWHLWTQNVLVTITACPTEIDRLRPKTARLTLPPWGFGGGFWCKGSRRKQRLMSYDVLFFMGQKSS